MKNFYSGEKLETNRTALQWQISAEVKRRIINYITYLYASEYHQRNSNVLQDGVKCTTRMIAEACNIRQATASERINQYVEENIIEKKFDGGYPQGGTIIKLVQPSIDDIKSVKL